MRTKIGRREFIGTASLAAAALHASRSDGGQAPDAAASAVARAKKFKKIDVEAHWSPPFPEFQGTRPGARPDADVRPEQVELFTNFDKRLRIMDDAGVTIQVVATRSRGIQGVPDAKAAITAAKKTNDLLSETILKYPSRLAGFASLPMQDPKASADELERAVTKLGFESCSQPTTRDRQSTPSPSSRRAASAMRTRKNLSPEFGKMAADVTGDWE